MKKLCLLLLFVWIACSAFAQFTIQGELRPRFEFRDGYRTINFDDADPAVLLSQRSLIGLMYKTDLYTTKISFQDVRVWGSEALKATDISTALCEAWVEFNAGNTFKIKVGRQILKYDNQRLIGAMNWNQVGARHDAIKLSYRKNGFEFEAVGAMNQTATDKDLVEVPYDLYKVHYKNLGILWLKQSFESFSIASLSIFEALRMNDMDDETSTRYTTGLVLAYNKSKVKSELRGFYQGGSKQSGDDVSAWYMNAIFHYNINKSFKLKAGFDLYTGNDDPNQIGDKDNAFNVIYGGRHIFNGKMDYFLNPASTMGLGLMDWMIGFDAKVSPKSTLMVDYHYFRTPNSFAFRGLDYKAYLGSEIDIQLNIKISKEATLSTMYGIMLPDDAMAAVKTPGSNPVKEKKTGHYFVSMLTFKPTFFKTK